MIESSQIEHHLSEKYVKEYNREYKLTLKQPKVAKRKLGTPHIGKVALLVVADEDGAAIKAPWSTLIV
jgi:hypothetical protein